jgi:hypothetical protein
VPNCQIDNVLDCLIILSFDYQNNGNGCPSIEAKIRLIRNKKANDSFASIIGFPAALAG